MKLCPDCNHKAEKKTVDFLGSPIWHCHPHSRKFYEAYKKLIYKIIKNWNNKSFKKKALFNLSQFNHNYVPELSSTKVKKLIGLIDEKLSSYEKILDSTIKIGGKGYCSFAGCIRTDIQFTFSFSGFKAMYCRKHIKYGKRIYSSLLNMKKKSNIEEKAKEIIHMFYSDPIGISKTTRLKIIKGFQKEIKRIYA